MIQLDSLVTDGVAKVGQSLFPTEVQIDSMGATGCRFMLIDDLAGGWIAGVWQANPVGGVPIQILLAKVDTIPAYTPGKIHLVLDDGRQVVITPGRGCGSCGGAGALRNYNPFGFAVNLARVPGPQ